MCRKMDIEVSIIVPIYNSSAFLDNLFLSIQNQSFIDFEVLLIDDGSTDDSQIKCINITEKDKRFKYIKKENEGVSSARNTGIEKAKGKFLAFIDSDDYILENHIMMMVKGIENVDLVTTGYFLKDEKECRKRVLPNGNMVIKTSNFYQYLLMDYSVFSFPWNKLYRKSIIDSQGIFFNKTIYYGEDLVFLMEYLSHVKKIRLLKTANYVYLNHDKSVSSQKINQKNLISRMTDVKAMKQTLRLLPQECRIEKQFIKQRLLLEGSYYYKLTFLFDFSNKEKAELKSQIIEVKKNTTNISITNTLKILSNLYFPRFKIKLQNTLKKISLKKER